MHQVEPPPAGLFRLRQRRDEGLEAGSAVADLHADQARRDIDPEAYPLSGAEPGVADGIGNEFARQKPYIPQPLRGGVPFQNTQGVSGLGDRFGGWDKLQVYLGRCDGQGLRSDVSPYGRALPGPLVSVNRRGGVRAAIPAS